MILSTSLARSGGNITGLSLMSEELAGKQLQLLKEATGSLGRVAVLRNSGDAAMTNIFSELQTAALVLGVTVQALGVQEAKDIDGAFARLTEERPDAFFMITDVLTLQAYAAGFGFREAAPARDDVLKQRICGRGRIDVLWAELHGLV